MRQAMRSSASRAPIGRGGDSCIGDLGARGPLAVEFKFRFSHSTQLLMSLARSCKSHWQVARESSELLPSRPPCAGSGQPAQSLGQARQVQEEGCLQGAGPWLSPPVSEVRRPLVGGKPTRTSRPVTAPEVSGSGSGFPSPHRPQKLRAA